MGDVQQLTPIGNCQVFADILNSDVLPIVRLTKPHRQAMRSGIIPTSMSIAHQEQIFNNHYEGNKILGELQDMELDIRKDKLLIKDLIISHFKTELEKNDKEITEVQVCIAKRVHGDLSCYSINNAIQEIYNPKFVQGNEIVIYMGKTSEGEKLEYHIRRNDKVINIKNNYDVKSIDNTSVSVFNGNIGIVKNIKDDGEAIIDFIGLGEVVFTANDCKNLELAYACTTHKLQGSQFKSVIVGIDNSSYIMNNAEWLYTAITRAQKYCVLVGQTGAVRKAIHTKEVNNKQTFLTALLNNQM
jgi:ATP-dependent exoDNAse (exonuclease V) alpha subunit